MGKKRHSKDRLFITNSEHKMEWGGKKDEKKIPIAKLPFYCCSLSLLPFDTPVCTESGIIFDIVNIVPFIKKYKRNPVTGEPLKLSDLIRLNFYKNQQGDYHDPISFKIFTDYTHIVAIKTSGNVYTYETIEQLNKNPKFWRDLMTDQTFTTKDIITIQDPKNVDQRKVTNFHYIKNNIDVSAFKNSKQNDDANKNINYNLTCENILKQLEQRTKQEENKEYDYLIPDSKKKIKIEEKQIQSQKPFNPEKFTTNDWVYDRLAKKSCFHERFTVAETSASATSTLVDLHTQNTKRLLTEEEIRGLYHKIVKNKQSKGYVQLVTNFGAINLEIFANFTPVTSENFLELCEAKYYNNTKFHRLVKNFMIQGGDPTGTGKGGESIYKCEFEDEFHPKLKHDKAGIISMANSGPMTNSSQFFITLAPCQHLDNKHTVFGEVVGNLAILDVFNEMAHEKKEKPPKEIIIYDTTVFVNPFREAIKEILKSEDDEKQKEQNKLKDKQNQDKRWLETDDKSSELKKLVQKSKSNLFSGEKDDSTISKILNYY